MEWLRTLVLKSDTKTGRLFDLGIQALILVSIASFSIETLPDLNAGTRQVLYWTERVTVAVFTVEYLLRVFLSPNPTKFIFSIWGAVDLLAIIPFYLSTAVDLRSVRAIRLLRLFRLLKLFRYNQAIQRLREALRSIMAELTVFTAASFLAIYIASVGIYYLERNAQPDEFVSVFSAMWWSVATLSTVGYGDIYPITAGGRIFASFVILVGVSLVAVPSGLFAAALTKAVQK